MIVNADDFGYSPAVNAGIFEAFKQDLITRATVMANMPGFEEACALVRAHGLDSRIGVHVNLVEGTPLTDAIRRNRRLCNADGRFLGPQRNMLLSWLSLSERRAVAAEVAAQVRHCRTHGLSVGHLDSHHHVHVRPLLAGLFIALSRSLRIETMRIARNCCPLPFANRVYNTVYNLRLRMHGLAGSRYLGGPDDLMAFIRAGTNPMQLTRFELVTHPTMREDGEVVDVERPGVPLSELLARLTA